MEESSGEGGGGRGGAGALQLPEVVVPAEGLRRSEIYHVVKEVIGFVLYMHQQIPSVLQHLEREFDNLREESKRLEGSAQTPEESETCSRRMHKLKIRVVKQGIRRLEKLMNSISSVLSSLRLILDEIPFVQGLMLVLGGSLVRPQYVYEMFFSLGNVDSASSRDSGKSKVAESISRKAIRALISKGAGGDSYAGPMKLFLLIKGPDTLKLPLHFLPKRDFKYHKKIIPFKLHVRCKTQKQGTSDSCYSTQNADSTKLLDISSSDLIWFQCRHVVKGLASKVPSAQ